MTLFATDHMGAKYDDITGPIEWAVNEYGRRFWRHVERDDLRQELWEWVIRRQTKIAHQRTTADNFEGWLNRALSNAAKDACQRLKAQTLGYSVNDLAYYEKRTIEELLPNIFDKSEWLEPPTPEGGDNGKSNSDPAHGNNFLATMVDLATAYDKLDDDEKRLLTERFRDQVPYTDLEKRYDTSRRTIYTRIDRALGKMQAQLGGKRPVPVRNSEEDTLVEGTRRVITNAHARAIGEHQYEEA